MHKQGLNLQQVGVEKFSDSIMIMKAKASKKKPKKSFQVDQ